MTPKRWTPDQAARHLEELQRPPAPQKRSEEDGMNEPEDPAGNAPAPAPVRPVPPTLSGKNAQALPEQTATEERAL